MPRCSTLACCAAGAPIRRAEIGTLIGHVAIWLRVRLGRSCGPLDISTTEAVAEMANVAALLSSPTAPPLAAGLPHALVLEDDPHFRFSKWPGILNSVLGQFEKDHEHG
jgi:hypothetical protein